MDCAGSKTSKAEAPVWAAPEVKAETKVESTETAAPVEPQEDVKTEPAPVVETEAFQAAETAAQVKEDVEQVVEEAEKAIGELKESELKAHIESKAEDTETVTTAPKEDSPRCLDVKVEAADVERGPCVCGSLW